MLQVYLLRHGETSYNADNNRYCGQTDIELTDKGMQQAAMVRQQLAGMQFNGLYSSPLKRAFNTAKIASGSQYVITDERLTELNFGVWEGKTKEEFFKEDPAAWEAWMNDPYHTKAGKTGDTGKSVVERVDDFYNEMLKKHSGGKILVVGHNGLNRLYLAYKLGMDLKNYRRIVQENSSITLFELDADGGLTLKLLNSKL